MITRLAKLLAAGRYLSRPSIGHAQGYLLKSGWANVEYQQIGSHRKGPVQVFHASNRRGRFVVSVGRVSGDALEDNRHQAIED